MPTKEKLKRTTKSIDFDRLNLEKKFKKAESISEKNAAFSPQHPRTAKSSLGIALAICELV